MRLSRDCLQEKNVGDGYILSELTEHTHPLPQDFHLLARYFF